MGINRCGTCLVGIKCWERNRRRSGREKGKPYAGSLWGFLAAAGARCCDYDPDRVAPARQAKASKRGYVITGELSLARATATDDTTVLLVQMYVESQRSETRTRVASTNFDAQARAQASAWAPFVILQPLLLLHCRQTASVAASVARIHGLPLHGHVRRLDKTASISDFQAPVCVRDSAPRMYSVSRAIVERAANLRQLKVCFSAELLSHGLGDGLVPLEEHLPWWPMIMATA